MTDNYNSFIKAKLREAQLQRENRIKRILKEENESPIGKLKMKFEPLASNQEERKPPKIEPVLKPHLIRRGRLRKSNCPQTQLFDPAEFIKNSWSSQPNQKALEIETLHEFERMCSICMEEMRDKT